MYAFSGTALGNGGPAPNQRRGARAGTEVRVSSTTQAEATARARFLAVLGMTFASYGWVKMRRPNQQRQLRCRAASRDPETSARMRAVVA